MDWATNVESMSDEELAQHQAEIAEEYEKIRAAAKAASTEQHKRMEKAKQERLAKREEEKTDEERELDQVIGSVEE